MCIGKKVRLKPMKRIQKLILPIQLVHHAPGELREPVIEGAEQREQRAADQDVMEMRDDEERVVHLQVERNRGQHYAASVRRARK